MHSSGNVVATEMHRAHRTENTETILYNHNLLFYRLLHWHPSLAIVRRANFEYVSVADRRKLGHGSFISVHVARFKIANP